MQVPYWEKPKAMPPSTEQIIYPESIGLCYFIVFTWAANIIVFLPQELKTIMKALSLSSFYIISVDGHVYESICTIAHDVVRF